MPSSGTASTHWPRGSGFMLRRGERAVVLGAIAAIVLAAVAGVVTAPTRDLDDPRLSSYLAGPHGAAADSSPVLSGAWRLPRAGRTLVPMPAESLAAATAERLDGDGCPPRLALRVDTLLGVRGGRPLAIRLGFRSGGEAILLADGGFLTNRSLKETDAGLAVLPWFADGRTRRVVVDE